MKILYYAWKEYTYQDAVEKLNAMGHDVAVDNTAYRAFDEDDNLIRTVSNKVKKYGSDIFFSFNYFPDLARVANDLGIRYVCWCCDSPLLTLESKTLENPCNLVFLFDRSLYERYRAQGINTAYHLPLACNSDRLYGITKDLIGKYEHDITLHFSEICIPTKRIFTAR